jgi:hypothetical protein
MEIAYHIGANCTDHERLLKSLLRNVNLLGERGVAVPGPGRYRPILREALTAQMQGSGAPDVREVLLDAILDERQARRLVLSNSAFLGLPPRVFDDGLFFGNARNKVAALRAIFAQDRIELHLALRNPATFIPAVWAQSRTRSVRAYMGDIEPQDVFWSDVIAAIREADPEAELTVWCNEDTPLIWGELLRRLAGLPGDAPLVGRYDLLGTIMAAEGLERFEKYMALHPGQTPEQERRVISAFLDKYAIPEETWEEVDLPGWDEALVEELTQAYEEDVERIGRLDGVTLIRP